MGFLLGFFTDNPILEYDQLPSKKKTKTAHTGGFILVDAQGLARHKCLRRIR